MHIDVAGIVILSLHAAIQKIF